MGIIPPVFYPIATLGSMSQTSRNSVDSFWRRQQFSPIPQKERFFASAQNNS
jgi:hypothetical protein